VESGVDSDRARKIRKKGRIEREKREREVKKR
jgi:hypothetical protein